MVVQAPFIEIDRTGDLFIKVFETDTDMTGANTDYLVQHSVLIRVSKQVLINNSIIFKEYLSSSSFDRQKPLEMRQIAAKSLEIWLRIFHHGDLPNELWMQLQMADIVDITELGIKCKFRMSRFNVWFAFWLGHQDLGNIALATLRQLGELCEIFQHRVGAQCVAVLTGIEPGHQLPKATSLFPPVPTMSLRQSTYQNQRFDTISPEHYTTWAFPPRFQAIYGTPTTSYSDFYRLVTTPFDHRALPKYMNFDVLMRTKSAHFAFCKAVDHKAAQNNRAPVARRATEAAWAWIALHLYEKPSSKDPVALRQVFSMRFNPRRKIEKYWADKCSTFGWEAKDVECLEDNCEEPDYEIAEPDDDDDDDGYVDEEPPEPIFTTQLSMRPKA